MPTNKTKAIIHCSDSIFGNAVLIDHWHRNRTPPFKKIGYTFVILNGKISAKRAYQPLLDGWIETGRHITEQGAHCRGKNDFIGICLIGKHSFSPLQFLSLGNLLHMLGLDGNDIHGHNEFDKNKTCPNFDLQKFIREYM